MKPNYSLKLKTTLQSCRATLQNPHAPIGFSSNGDCITYKVENIPSTVPAHEVLFLFNLTATVSGHVFQFHQLRAGAIAKGE